MTTKELIRKEIERRKKYQLQQYHDTKSDGRPNDDWAESLAIIGELEALLSFLDALPDEPVSEDETIRKFLIQHISEWIGCIEHDLKISSKDIESEKELAMFKAGLAYLEKQKEQKQYNDDPLNNPRFLDGFDVGREVQKIFDEQKPAEWSEGNEKKMIFLERLIEHNVPDGQYGWADGRKGGFVTKSEAISMLKSLRPSWKPSEEQMGVDLEKEIENYWLATDWCNILQLKKFKVIARYFYGLGLNARKEEEK